MQTFGDTTREAIRYYARGRLTGLAKRSIKDLLVELKQIDPKTVHQVIQAVVGSLANAEENSARTENMRRQRELDNVDFCRGLESGIPIGALNFEGFQHREEYPTVHKALVATQAWAQGVGPGVLTLAGPTGTGKTYLGIAAAQELLRRGQSILYREEADFVGSLQSQMRGGNPDDFLAEFLDVPWLVLDDMGVTALSEWGKGIMDRLINVRWQGSGWLRTMITTNLTSDQMPVRIASRLGDERLAKQVVIKAGDFRRGDG